MENDSPNLFDSEPMSIKLTLAENNEDIDTEINESDEILSVGSINKTNRDQVQDEIEYRTDESDQENENSIENRLTNVDESIDQQNEDSSTIKTKDVHKGLPPGRVKLIMKMHPDVNIVAGDAVFLVTKATEGFVGLLAQHCYKAMVASNKKTLQKKHIDDVIQENVPFEFLEGALDW